MNPTDQLVKDILMIYYSFPFYLYTKLITIHAIVLHDPNPGNPGRFPGE